MIFRIKNIVGGWHDKLVHEDEMSMRKFLYYLGNQE